MVKKDGEQVGGKVFLEKDDIIFQKIIYNLAMTIETVQVNITSSIATVVLNRPSVLNAFNEQLVLELKKHSKI